MAGNCRVRDVPSTPPRVDNGEASQLREHVVRVKDLRLERGWSQAELAERSGLSIRTIQRIEGGAHPGLESLTLLARAFGVAVGDLQAGLSAGSRDMSFGDAVRHGLRHYDDFAGVGRRSEFWWFALAVALAISVAQALSVPLATAVAVIALVPLLAATTRRLRDAGQSPWWLLMLLVPIGGLVVVGTLLAMPSRTEADQREAAAPIPDPS
jgi:transcriptional regulator with XRE-family HTH domain